MQGNHKIQKTAGTENGFTLIEVLMAMAVFSIGFLALASMQITATNGNARARSLMDAVSVLEDHMEYLKNLPNTQDFQDTRGIPEDLDPAHNPHELVVEDMPTGGDRRFNGTLRWWVFDDDNPDPDGMPDNGGDVYPANAIKIDVEVEWSSLMQERRLRYTFVRVRDIM